MRVSIVDRKTYVTINSKYIPIGTVFSGQIGPYTPSIFIKSYSAVVSLKNPLDDWLNNIMVKDYMELDAELIVMGV